jgi:hypothetical protein
MLAMLTRALVFAGCFSVCLCKIYESVSDLPGNLIFDFVIIGGGTAGNVVANRLSENPDYSILVLEAGGSLVFSSRSIRKFIDFRRNVGVLDSIVPFFVGNLLGPTIYDWSNICRLFLQHPPPEK